MRRPIALVLTLALTLTAGAFVARAQEPVDASRLDAQLQDAAIAFERRNVDEAGRLYAVVLEAATKAGLETQRARALLGVANAANSNRRRAEAEPLAREALARFERLGIRDGVARASHLLSLIAEGTGRLVESRAFAERAVEAFQDSSDLKGRIRASLQLMDVTNPPLDEKRARFEQLAKLASDAGDVEMEGILWHGLGDRMHNAARFEEALPMLTRAAALFQKAGDTASLGAVYNSLGRLYRAHGLYEEALKFQQQALALHEKSGSAYYLTQSLNAVAVVEGLLGNVARSREYYERALVVAEQQMRSPETRDFLRANIATRWIEEGRFTEAAQALETVLANPTRAREFDAVRHGQLSYAYLGLGRKADALAAAEQASTTCGAVLERCGMARAYRASAHAALGDLPAALTDIDAALADLDTLRTRLVPTDFFRQNFPVVHEYLYGVAINLQFDGGRPERGLEAAERARARCSICWRRRTCSRRRPPSRSSSLPSSRSPCAGPARPSRHQHRRRWPLWPRRRPRT